MLRSFACLSTDDVISIKYNERVSMKHFWLYLVFNEIRSWECKSKFIIFYFQNYDLLVLETKPDRAVSIIECDMNVSIPKLLYTFVKCNITWS